MSLPDGVHERSRSSCTTPTDLAATATAIARGLALVIVPSGEATIWDRLPLDGLIVVDPVPDTRGSRCGQAVPIVTVGKLPGGDVDTRVVDSDYPVGTAAMLDHLRSGAARVES